MALKLAFHAGKQLCDDHLLAAIPEVRPLSKTDPEAVTEITQWLDAHAKPAGGRQSQALAACMNGTPKRRRLSLN